MPLPITGIVAVDSDFLLGFNSAEHFRMPWSHNAMREDMDFFRKTTRASWLLVGRKTLESIGRFLPGRFHLVLSRQSQFDFYGHTITSSTNPEAPATLVPSWQDLEQLLSTPEKFCLPEQPPGKIFLIGGAEVLASALDFGWLSDLYLTIVEAQLKETAQPEEQAIYLPENLARSIREKLKHNPQSLQQLHKNALNNYAANIYHFKDL